MNRLRISLLLLVVIAAFTITSQAEAGKKPDYTWEVQTPNYFLELSEPIGRIPGIPVPSPGMSIETKYAMFAKAGFVIFDQIREKQEKLIWCVARLTPNKPSENYDGLLSQVILELKDGRKISPTLILASSVTKARFASMTGGLSPVFTLYAQGTIQIPVTYDQFTSETNDGDRWHVYLGFPRVFAPKDIESVAIPVEDATQAYSPSEPASAIGQPKGGS